MFDCIVPAKKKKRPGGCSRWGDFQSREKWFVDPDDGFSPRSQVDRIPALILDSTFSLSTYG